MRTKLIIAAALLGLAIPVAADFKLITQGYEVALSDLRLPQNDGGTIAFKPCADCGYETRRVATNANWVFNGHNVELDKFRLRTGQLDNRDRHIVTVTRHVESNQVTKVAITVVSVE